MYVTNIKMNQAWSTALWLSFLHHRRKGTMCGRSRCPDEECCVEAWMCQGQEMLSVLRLVRACTLNIAQLSFNNRTSVTTNKWT